LNSNAWLRLFRIGGVGSALSSSLAGALLSPFPISSLNLTFTLLISIGLYLLGMVSNDLLDIEKDKKLRPDRPLALQLIPIQRVIIFLLSLGLAILCLSLALRPSQRLCFGLSALLILLYNGPLKSHFWLSSVCLGAARAFNFFGGYGPTWIGWSEIIIFTSIALHIITIMLVAKGEDESEPIPLLAWFFWFFQSACLAMLGQWLVLPWSIWTGFHLWQFKNSDRYLRPRCVGILVASLTLLDGTLLLFHHHVYYAMGFILIYILGRRLSKKFPVG
jgi:4-hydroxybenzoate polyprenyltransferase